MDTYDQYFDALTSLNDRFFDATTQAGAPVLGELGEECRLQVPLRTFWAVPSGVPESRRLLGLDASVRQEDYADLAIVHFPSGVTEGWELNVVTNDPEDWDGNCVRGYEVALHAMTWYLRTMANVGARVVNLAKWIAATAVQPFAPGARIDRLPTSAEAYDMAWTCPISHAKYESFFERRTDYLLDVVGRPSTGATLWFKADGGRFALLEVRQDGTAQRRFEGGIPPGVLQRLESFHQEASRIAWLAAKNAE